MARNRIQFQMGLSETGFSVLYGAEARWRWPDGFMRPACGHREHCVLARRALYQCNACRTQTSLTAGTIFASTKVGLSNGLTMVRNQKTNHRPVIATEINFLKLIS